MAATTYWYGLAIAKAFNKEIDFDESGKIKCILCTSTYTPAQDTHDYYDDITNELTTTGGYTAGGKALTGCAISYTAGTNVIKFDADDVTWTAFTGTFRYAILYYDTATASTSPLICYVDFGENVGATASDYTIEWNSGGILTCTPAAPA